MDSRARWLRFLGIAALLLTLLAPSSDAAKGDKGKPQPGDDEDPALGTPAIAYLQDTRYQGSGPGELWVMDADGTHPRKLLDEGVALPPRWNPEGTALAFGGDFRAPEGDGIYVLLLQPDGTWLGPTKIVDTWSQVFKLDWSPTAPDGKQYLAFETFLDRNANGLSDDTDIFVIQVDLDGPVASVGATGEGDALRVKSTPDRRERHPAWSRDGTRLAFTSNSIAGEYESPHDLVVVTFAFDGGIGVARVENLTLEDEDTPRPLDGADVRQPCWQRRGDELLVLTRGITSRIWTVDPLAVEQAQCVSCSLDPQALNQPCWSPDDTSILYNGSTADFPTGALYLLDIQERTSSVLVDRLGRFKGGKYPTNRYQPAWKR